MGDICPSWNVASVLKLDVCRNACIDTDGWGDAKNSQMVFRNMSHVLVDVPQLTTSYISPGVAVKEAQWNHQHSETLLCLFALV